MRITSQGFLGLGTSTPPAFMSLFTATTSIIDITASSTGNNLLEGKYLSQNFGMSMETGAFISRNSYFGEEFMRHRGDIIANAAQIWGDFQQFGVSESSDCVWSTVNNAINGIGRQQANNGANSCLAYHASAIGTAHTVFNAANLPVFTFKVSPSTVASNIRFWIGASNLAVAQATDPLNGIYFTNNTVTGEWQGVARRAGVSTVINCTGQAINTAVFGVAKIEVISSNGDGTGEINFYVDNDTTDGVDWFYCGQATTNIPTVNLTSMIMNNTVAGGAVQHIDIDYYRVWQDDAPAPANPTGLVFEESEVFEEESTIEERVVILEDKAVMSENQIIDLSLALNELHTSIDNNFESIDESINALNVSLSETQAMIEALNSRVSILENNAITTDQSIISLSDMMTDFDLRLSELASSSSGLVLSGEVFDSLTANVLVIYDSALFEGTLKVKKHVTFGEDTIGQGLILTGHTSTTIIFAEPYEIAPIINITPIDFDGKWKLSEVSTSGFKILISEIQSVDVLFNWQAIGASADSKVFVSDGTINPIGLQIDYVPEPAPEEPVIEEPVSEEPIAEEPVAEEPAPTEEPAIEDEPAPEEPVIEEPVSEEPIAEEPVAEEPAPIEEPAIEDEPAPEEPAEEPAPAEEPVVEEPVAEPPVE